jgi:hypothetical protein
LPAQLCNVHNTPHQCLPSNYTAQFTDCQVPICRIPHQSSRQRV